MTEILTQDERDAAEEAELAAMRASAEAAWGEDRKRSRAGLGLTPVATAALAAAPAADNGWAKAIAAVNARLQDSGAA